MTIEPQVTTKAPTAVVPPTPPHDEADIWRQIGLTRPPREDELPCSDGMPMDSERQALQMDLLWETLRLFWAERTDVYVGKNQFLYFSADQVRTQDFLGPDVYVVLDVPKRERKCWVIWEEGKGPDVVIEVLSPRTQARDKSEKKRIYQDKVRAPEYFWYDPDTGEWAGFALREGVYEPIEGDAQGRMVSRRLNLALVTWEGTYRDVTATWLRWATLDGTLLPTNEELTDRAQAAAEAERARAEAEQARAEAERERAEQAQRELAEARALLARYRERFGEPPA
jgi:Uma2 family endonuclease